MFSERAAYPFVNFPVALYLVIAKFFLFYRLEQTRHENRSAPGGLRFKNRCSRLFTTRTSLLYQ